MPHSLLITWVLCGVKGTVGNQRRGCGYGDNFIWSGKRAQIEGGGCWSLQLLVGHVDRTPRAGTHSMASVSQRHSPSDNRRPSHPTTRRQPDGRARDEHRGFLFSRPRSSSSVHYQLNDIESFNTVTDLALHWEGSLPGRSSRDNSSTVWRDRAGRRQISHSAVNWP